MSKATSVLATLVLVLTAPTALAAESRWLDSLDQAVAEAAEGDRLILVGLYAEWCGWCKALDEKVFESPLFQEHTRDYVLLKLDVEDGAEGTEFQASFGVTGLPTTLVIDKDMTRVATVKGFSPAAKFLTQLDADLESYRAFLASTEKAQGGGDCVEAKKSLEEFLSTHPKSSFRAAAEKILDDLRQGTSPICA